jgi:hypothetical protein
MKKLIKEGGIRDIKALAKRYPKAKIYFHQDLDGVTTALAMREYLKSNGIDVVDTEIIQYGDKEFAIKKLDAEGDTMPVLVDFAHGKPMFTIHTDHHDRQAGAEDTKSKSFRSARSNVETISQVVSPKDIFTSDDIKLISTVDSANFKTFGIKPKDVMNYILTLDKEGKLEKNKMALGLIVNKLILAYKNKPGFMEELVMNASPSLLNIYQSIKNIAKNRNFASPEEMQKNQELYVQSQKDSKDVVYEDGIIKQYGGGSMFKPGSYDRYTPFENYPEADFLVIAWPLGLVQASCNPFKEDRALKGVDLGKIKDEILSENMDWMKKEMVPLSTLKWISETSANESSVGFTSTDLKAFYMDKVQAGNEEYISRLDDIMDKKFKELTEEELMILDSFAIPFYDLVIENSGGHKCITNISGLNYLRRSKRPPQGDYRKPAGAPPTKYIQGVKYFQEQMFEKLKEYIKSKEDSGVE